MEQQDTNNLLYFEYRENKKCEFDTQAFAAKYRLNFVNEKKLNVFSFLEELLEQNERIRLLKWKERLKENKKDVSTFSLDIKTKDGIRGLTLTMIPIVNEQNQEIEYYVGYFS